MVLKHILPTLKTVKTIPYLLLAIVVASCSEPEPTKPVVEKASLSKNKTSDYNYQIHGVTLNNPYHWLSQEKEPSQQADIAQWKNQQIQQEKAYFSELQDSLSSNIDEQSSNGLYDLSSDSEDLFTQQYWYRFYSIKHNAYSQKEKWQISFFDSLESKQTNHTLPIPDNVKDISSFVLAPGARYAALLFKTNLNQYRWQIYDQLNKQFLKLNLPITDNASSFIWFSGNRYITSTDNALYLASLKESFVQAKMLINSSSLVEENKNWVLSSELNFESSQLLIKLSNPVIEQDKFWYLNLSRLEEKPQVLIDKVKASFTYLANLDDTYYFLTNLAAGRNRIVSLDINSPARRNWKEVVEQDNGVLLDAKLVNRRWILNYLENTQAKLITSSLNGNNQKVVNIFGAQTVHMYNKQIKHLEGSDYSSSHKSSVLINLSSIWSPQKSFLLSNNSLSSLTQVHSLENNKQLDVVSNVNFYRTEDGSKIPLTRIFKKESNTGIPQPTLLLANQLQSKIFNYEYNPLFMSFIKAGGVIVIVHNRGGGTYGKNWHKAASGKKQFKVLEDINSAIAWLFENNYSSPEKLAIYAEADNSPIFAQLINQQAEFISAAIFNDAYFDLFDNPYTENTLWKKEFNLTTNKSSIISLLSKSPLQNIQQQNYPATFVLNGGKNKKAWEYIAKLQNHQLSGKSLLIDLEPVINNINLLEQDQKTLYFLNKEINLNFK